MKYGLKYLGTILSIITPTLISDAFYLYYNFTNDLINYKISSSEFYLITQKLQGSDLNKTTPVIWITCHNLTTVVAPNTTVNYIKFLSYPYIFWYCESDFPTYQQFYPNQDLWMMVSWYLKNSPIKTRSPEKNHSPWILHFLPIQEKSLIHIQHPIY